MSGSVKKTLCEKALLLRPLAPAAPHKAPPKKKFVRAGEKSKSDATENILKGGFIVLAMSVTAGVTLRLTAFLSWRTLLKRHALEHTHTHAQNGTEHATMAQGAFTFPRCLIGIVVFVSASLSPARAETVAACAPNPNVKMPMAGDTPTTTVVSLGIRGGGGVALYEAGSNAGENFTCGSGRPAVYVVVTLPSRGMLLDAHTLARITAAPHVLAPGVRRGELLESRTKNKEE